MMKKLRLILILLLLSNSLFANEEFVKIKRVQLKAGLWQKVKLSHGATSFVFRSDMNWQGTRILVDSKESLLEHDHHSPSYTSKLYMKESTINEIGLKSVKDIELEVIELHVPFLKQSVIANLQIAADSCKKPAGIDQSIWRDGLSPPAPNPSLNKVNHCIVHHSAGSNTSTNYTEVVRNIYVFHTTVNGWDDIGYNYLIAQDGTLFHGRDGQGQIEDDNVRGAHFCAKNTGTMGICILGNYMTVLPPQAALDKLEDLMLWKFNKESLNPLDSSRHPLPGGAFLPRIAGHQDGCATNCPGTFLYALLPDVIDSVARRINDCLPFTALDNQLDEDYFNFYPNPAMHELRVTSLEAGYLLIKDINGRIIREISIRKEVNISLEGLKSGLYILVLNTENRTEQRKLLIID